MSDVRKQICAAGIAVADSKCLRYTIAAPALRRILAERDALMAEHPVCIECDRGVIIRERDALLAEHEAHKAGDAGICSMCLYHCQPYISSDFCVGCKVKAAHDYAEEVLEDE